MEYVQYVLYVPLALLGLALLLLVAAGIAKVLENRTEEWWRKQREGSGDMDPIDVANFKTRHEDRKLRLK